MKTSTGIEGFDNILEGGYQNAALNMVYGPGASGKTTFCICFSVSLAKEGKKVVFIDSENSLSLERLSQVAYGLNLNKILENIIILKPKSFIEQFRIINKLAKAHKSNISTIVVDTVGFHYRAQSKDGNLNAHLAKQLSDLKYLATQKDIPVILTNQVYSDINTPEGKINLVGGEMVKNWCSYLIELQKTRNRRAVIHKPFRKEFLFEIRNEGIFVKG